MVENQKFIEELEAEINHDIAASKVAMATEQKEGLKLEETIKTEQIEQDTNSETPVLSSPKLAVKPKRIRGSIVEDECKIEVPEGWRRQVVQRQGGLSAGKFDVYYYSPLGKKLRSRKEVQQHCEMNNIEADIELFRFTRISLSNQKGVRGKPRSIGLTPKLTKSPKTPKLPKTQKSPKLPKTPKQKKINSPTKSSDAVKKKPRIKLENNKSSFKISSDGLLKKRKKSVWVPPKSPFNLFQESMFQNPWKLLVGTVLLNRSSGDEIVGNSVLWEFLKKWSTPETTMNADWREIAELLKPMTNGERLAKMLIKFSEEYLTKKWTYPKELHGIGKFGNDSYRIFCINEWKKVKPIDFLLTFYVDWLWDNHTVLGLD